MDDSRYEQDYQFDEYEPQREPGMTSVGLPPGQLALIIGVNAVISLIISISVVLMANRQVLPAESTALAQASPETITATLQSGAATTPAAESSTEVEQAENNGTGPATYTVQAGDTLGLIAEKFSVPLSELMAANGLTNKDFIQIGQTLIIPIGGLPTPTVTFTAVPVPTDTPLPFDPPTPLPTDAEIPPEPAATVGPSPTPTETPSPTPSPSPSTSPSPSPIPSLIPTSTPAPFDEINVVINEIIGEGDLLRETLVILNEGAGTSLKDWKLEGSSLGIFVFPDIFLFSGGSIRIHTAAGENTASDLYLSQGEAAWPPGTTIILSDANNTEISRFTVPEEE